MKKEKCEKCMRVKTCKPYSLCERCLIKDGSDYTSANFDLEGLSWHERAIVFMYAAGCTEYVDALVQAHLGRIDAPAVDEVETHIRKTPFFAEFSTKKKGK